MFPRAGSTVESSSSSVASASTSSRGVRQQKVVLPSASFFLNAPYDYKIKVLSSLSLDNLAQYISYITTNQDATEKITMQQMSDEQTRANITRNGTVASSMTERDLTKLIENWFEANQKNLSDPRVIEDQARKGESKKAPVNDFREEVIDLTKVEGKDNDDDGQEGSPSAGDSQASPIYRAAQSQRAADAAEIVSDFVSPTLQDDQKSVMPSFPMDKSSLISKESVGQHPTIDSQQVDKSSECVSMDNFHNFLVNPGNRVQQRPMADQTYLADLQFGSVRKADSMMANANDVHRFGAPGQAPSSFGPYARAARNQLLNGPQGNNSVKPMGSPLALDGLANRQLFNSAQANTALLPQQMQEAKQNPFILAANQNGAVVKDGNYYRQLGWSKIMAMKEASDIRRQKESRLCTPWYPPTPNPSPNIGMGQVTSSAHLSPYATQASMANQQNHDDLRAQHLHGQDVRSFPKWSSQDGRHQAESASGHIQKPNSWPYNAPPQIQTPQPPSFEVNEMHDFETVRQVLSAIDLPPVSGNDMFGVPNQSSSQVLAPNQPVGMNNLNPIHAQAPPPRVESATSTKPNWSHVDFDAWRHKLIMESAQAKMVQQQQANPQQQQHSLGVFEEQRPTPWSALEPNNFATKEDLQAFQHYRLPSLATFNAMSCQDREQMLLRVPDPLRTKYEVYCMFSNSRTNCPNRKAHLFLDDFH